VSQAQLESRGRLSTRAPIQTTKLESDNLAASTPSAPNMVPNEHRFRLVIFDLDGTLFRGLDYSWRLVWKYLGYDDQIRRRAMQRYLLRKTSYQEWCDYCCLKFVEKGLRRADFKKIVAPVRLTKNFHPAIGALRRAGLVLALISGGIDVFLSRKIPDAEELFDYIFINKFVFRQNGLLEKVVATPFDFAGKREGAQQICRERGFRLEQTVLVGEGLNDVDVAEAVGLRIAYAPRSQRLREMADVVIRKNDLSLILPHILRG
jgi:HAD superfamily phosphoserine phosphatase-like hydrolase